MDELEQNKDKIFWTWSKILIFSQPKNVFRKKIFFKIFKISTSNSKHFPPSKYFSPLALHQSQSQCQVRLISPHTFFVLQENIQNYVVAEICIFLPQKFSVHSGFLDFLQENLQNLLQNFTILWVSPQNSPLAAG